MEKTTGVRRTRADVSDKNLDGNKCFKDPDCALSYVNYFWEGKSVIKSDREINCVWD